MGKLTRPLVPDGPISRFYQRLHELHLAAGEPSMRALQRATRGPRRPGGINPTTIHKVFSSPKLSRWEVVREIVGHLSGDVDEFEQLWRQARDAGVIAAGGEEAAPPARDVPRELPAAAAGFTGRESHVKELDGVLGAAAADNTVAVAAIVGPGGVGKTTLALRWAQQVQDRFPDGQLWVDLRGYSPGAGPIHPIEVLARFLRTLGVPPEEIPTETAAAAARFRSVLAGRRVLVLLDNAAEADQVRPLLPGSPGCLVLVTSRDRLAGLVARDGAHRVSVDVLDAAESRTLLSRLLGAERVAAEPAAVDELARRCSWLPLALRIAAAWLVHHPGRRIAACVAELERPGGMGLLEVDDDPLTGIRRTFDLSYQAACADGQRLFRLLGLVPAADITAAAAAALAGLPVPEAGRLLDRLAGAHLVYPHSPGRYTWHDLLHQYAAERAHQDEPAAARAAALTRWYGWYLHTTEAAADVLYPRRMLLPTPPAPDLPTVEFPDRARATAWLDAEYRNLITVITHAAASPGNRPVAWLLLAALHAYFWLGMHAVDWDRAAQAALAAAETEGDLLAQAAVLLSAGTLQTRLSRTQPAIDALTRALRCAEAVGWARGLVAIEGSLGMVYRDLGELPLATAHLHRALAACYDGDAATGDAATGGADNVLTAYAAVSLATLSSLYQLQGNLAEALAFSHRALALYRGAGSRHGEAATLADLGETCRLRGELRQAMEYLTEALPIARDVGDAGNQAAILRDLAATYRDAGQLEQALTHAQDGLQLAQDLADPRLAAVARNTLATIHHESGRHEEAQTGHRQALDLARTIGDRQPQVEALLGLAAVSAARGRADEAAGYAGQARDLAHQSGLRLLAQRAQAALR